MGEVNIGSCLPFLYIKALHSLCACKPAYLRLIKILQRSKLLVFGTYQLITEYLIIGTSSKKKDFNGICPLVYFKRQVLHQTQLESSVNQWIDCI